MKRALIVIAAQDFGAGQRAGYPAVWGTEVFVGLCMIAYASIHLPV